MVAIIDYGMGNIHSVQKAIQLSGADTLVTDKPEEITAADRVVLPGVGAFDDAMIELRRRRLISTITELIRNRKPFLGICLGMQILFSGSEEASISKGLNVVSGMVKKFRASKDLKIPHMGWNQLKIGLQDCPLLSGIADNSYVYFCHSYYPVLKEEACVAAKTEYGLDFASVIWKDNLYGVQFHPEKSQKAGLDIIKNFVTLC